MTRMTFVWNLVKGGAVLVGMCALALALAWYLGWEIRFVPGL